MIRLAATSGPDGVPHLSAPVGAAGELEVAVVVTAKAPASRSPSWIWNEVNRLQPEGREQRSPGQRPGDA